MKACRSWLRASAGVLSMFCAVSSFNESEAVTIEGTEYPSGTDIDDEFASLGVLFSSGLGYVTFATDDFAGIFGTQSGAQWVGIAGASFSASIEATFIVPGNPLMPGIVNGTISARFGDGGGDLDSLRLRAFDIHDQPIGSVTSEATDFGSISLTGAGIHRVIFDQDPAGSLQTNTALDFLTFPEPVAVPEPAVAAVLGLGLPLVGMRRWHRSRAYAACGV